MIKKITFIAICSIALSCASDKERTSTTPTSSALEGTWQMISGTIIEKGDTTVTDYTRHLSFIKIINATHFSFLQHDKNKGKDSTAVFVAGGGSYSLKDSVYTEHLEYCSAREWEGNDFTFTVTIKNDTLIQQGVEEVQSAGIKRINLERYVRVKQ